MPETAGEVALVVYDSLASDYARCVQELKELTGTDYTSINIVGGGSNNAYLNQATADATGLPVFAGPTEGTALGNLMVQFIAEGALGIIFGAATETFPGVAAFTPEIIGQMLFLAVFASVVAFGIQNVSLAHVPPTQASLLLSLESVFGVVFSILLYGEQMTLRLVAGFVLIFAAIVISETLPLKEKPCRRKTTSS